MTLRLNDEQQMAATTFDVPVVVTAGAGSGKTRVLTQRFTNAVTPGAVEGWDAAGVDEIVAITFTEKAAGELADRVRTSLKSARRVEEARRMDNAWVSTIHGLCSRLLRRHALDVGIDPLFAVADTITVGNLRAEAFEMAASERLAASDEVAGLLDAYPFATIFSAVLSVSRGLAERGWDASAIELEGAVSVGELIEDATALFSHGCSACSEYAGSAKAASEFTLRCEGLLERALAMHERESDDGALRELASLVGAYRPLRAGVKGLEDASAESRESLADVAGAVGAAFVAPHARALAELAAAFSAQFSALKHTAGVLDFDDLQSMAVGLLESRPEIAARYRDRFRMVMIDEFQDTDALQLRLVNALADGDLCTVGDEKQSIYRFRGADIAVYRQHLAEMDRDGALRVSLGTNYRSHRDVLSFVNATFASEQYFDGDLLRLVPPEGPREPQVSDRALEGCPRVEAVFVDTHDVGTRGCRDAEASVIARRLRELADRGVDAGDMAILMRSYSSAHIYAEALAAVGLPAIIVGGSRFFGLEEVAVMRALTRVIANTADGDAVGQLLVSEFCPISDDGLVLLRADAGGVNRGPLWDLLRMRRDRLGEEDAKSAERLVGLVDAARASTGSRPLSDVLLRAVEDAGWDLRLLSSGNTGRDAFANVLKFARLAERFEAGEASGPAGFSAYLDAKEAMGDVESPAAVADDNAQAVRIMSVHASKGL